MSLIPRIPRIALESEILEVILKLDKQKKIFHDILKYGHLVPKKLKSLKSRGTPLGALLMDSKYFLSTWGILDIFNLSIKNFFIANFFLLFLVLVQANAKRNFDETIEAHVRLGIDRRRTDQVFANLFKLVFLI